MGTLVFQANLGGAVNLIGPNTASTVNFTLPSADGTSGQALVTNGSGTLSFSTFTSGAAGSNTQVQFNSSGAFAGSANLTFNGTTLTAANTSVTTSETLSYGTANGVAYLNGSKVVTTGSALTFDGTNLNVGNGSVTTTNNFFTATTSGYFFAGAGGFAGGVYGSNSGNYANIKAPTDIVSIIGSTEQMRLTSTGLGIGTSSPGTKLEVNRGTTANASATGATTRTNSAFAIAASIDTNSRTMFGVDTNTNGWVQVQNTNSNGVADFIINPVGGNLGLGVTPSAWGTGGKGFDLSSYSAVYQNFGNNATGIGNNVYINSTPAFIYKNTAAASTYQQVNGVHYWYNAPSGTAGNAISFTQAMTLNASGNLLVGTTSSVASNRKTISLTDDSGIATVPLTDLGQNGYVDINITNAVNGSVMAVQLMVTNTFKANAAARTSTLYAIFDRGLNNTTITSIASANGSAGGASFTVTVPSSGVIRITNTVAGICSLSAVATVVTGF